jgi:hypothetical protein
MPIRQFFLLAVIDSPIDEGILSLFKGSVIIILVCHFDLLAADQAAAEVVTPCVLMKLTDVASLPRREDIIFFKGTYFLFIPLFFSRFRVGSQHAVSLAVIDRSLQNTGRTLPM